MSIIKSIYKELEELSNKKIASHSYQFFKAYPGGYGEGDKFLGIRVPILRGISKKYRTITLEDIEKLIISEYHEIRLLSLFILVLHFKKAKEDEQKTICDFYLRHTEYINNWDLVDSSAHYILGPYLIDKDKQVLYQMAKSTLLWDRRIGMMTTFHFIKQGQFNDALNIAEILVNDNHDLIHKAVGWMLREIGNRDRKVEEEFLEKYYKTMPRTMLRYAIEKFSREERTEYLSGRKYYILDC